MGDTIKGGQINEEANYRVGNVEIDSDTGGVGYDLEERKSDKRLSYFKGQNFPSKLQLTLFLKTNYQKELNNKQIFLFWK